MHTNPFSRGFSARALARKWTLALVLSSGLAISASARLDDPPLKGPGVSERNVPGVTPSFGEPGDMQRKMGERLPPPVLREAIMHALTGDDAKADVRASDAQREKITTIVKDFESQMREFRKTNGPEFERLRSEAGLRRPGPGGPGGLGGPGGSGGKSGKGGLKSENPGQPPTPEQEAAREKLKALETQAPKLEDTMTKIWAELTPVQKQAVESELSVARERAAKEREDGYVRRHTRGGEDGPGPRGPGGPQGGPQGGPRGGDPARRERLMQIFDRMSPDQQDQLLRRIEERMGDADAPPPRGRRGPRGPGPDAPPPPPPSDR